MIPYLHAWIHVSWIHASWIMGTCIMDICIMDTYIKDTLCLKGAKHAVKRPKGSPTKCWGPEGLLASSFFNKRIAWYMTHPFGLYLKCWRDDKELHAFQSPFDY